MGWDNHLRELWLSFFLLWLVGCQNVAPINSTQQQNSQPSLAVVSQETAEAPSVPEGWLSWTDPKEGFTLHYPTRFALKTDEKRKRESLSQVEGVSEVGIDAASDALRFNLYSSPGDDGSINLIVPPQVLDRSEFNPPEHFPMIFEQRSVSRDLRQIFVLI